MSEAARPTEEAGRPTAARQLDAEFRRGRGRLLTAIGVGHAVKHTFRGGMSTIIMPQIKIGLGLSRAQFGALATASSVTNSLSTFTAGYLGDRFSRKAPLMLGISLGLMGVSFLMAGFAPNYWAMFAAMLLIGVGPAMFHPPALSTLSHRFPDRRGFAVSLHGMGANVGEVLGPLTVAGLLAFMVWRDVLKVSVLPALLAAFLIWAVVRSAPRRERLGVASIGEYLVSVRELLKNRVLVVLVLATALRGIGESAVGAYIPLYLIDDLEMEEWKVGLFLSGSMTAGIVSQPVLGYLSDRFGRKAVLVPGTASLALLSLALAVAEPGVQLVLVIVAKGAFSFSLHHIFIAAALDATRGHVQSTVVAMIYGASFLGTFSPFVAGLIADAYGIHSAFIYGGSIMLLPTLLLLMVKISGPERGPTAGVGGEGSRVRG